VRGSVGRCGANSETDHLSGWFLFFYTKWEVNMKRILELMKPALLRSSEMFHKLTYLLVILVCLALVIPSFSCAAEQSSVNKRLEIQLEKAPRLNEPVNLTCIRQTGDFVPPGQEKKISDNVSQGENDFVPIGQEKKVTDKTKHEKITLEFERVDPKTRLLVKVPAQEVHVGGNLNWEGDITGEPLEFSATIKFPYEGNWGIYVRSTYRPEDSDSIFLSVAEDSGSFGWPEDYRPSTSHSFPITPSQRWPISVELDIPKPPLVNEPVQLTWSINSIRDIDEVISEVKFQRMEGTDRVEAPAKDMLIEGDLTWKGSLKKDSPLNFSVTVRFPLEGDWGIVAIADSYVEQEPINASSRLFLHAAKDKSRWGWTESHEKPLQGPPPIPKQ